MLEMEHNAYTTGIEESIKRYDKELFGNVPKNYMPQSVTTQIEERCKVCGIQPSDFLSQVLQNVPPRIITNNLSFKSHEKQSPTSHSFQCMNF